MKKGLLNFFHSTLFGSRNELFSNYTMVLKGISGAQYDSSHYKEKNRQLDEL